MRSCTDSPSAWICMCTCIIQTLPKYWITLFIAGQPKKTHIHELERCARYIHIYMLNVCTLWKLLRSATGPLCQRSRRNVVQRDRLSRLPFHKIWQIYFIRAHHYRTQQTYTKPPRIICFIVLVSSGTCAQTHMCRAHNALYTLCFIIIGVFKRFHLELSELSVWYRPNE